MSSGDKDSKDDVGGKDPVSSDTVMMEMKTRRQWDDSSSGTILSVV